MKILVLPILLILLPILILFLSIKFGLKGRKISLVLKVFIGIIFIGIGLLSSLYAIGISMDAMSAKGVNCMIGIAVFIPFGLFINLAGIPLVLKLFERI